MQRLRWAVSPFDEDDVTSPATVLGRSASAPVDIERLAFELADVADGHMCATCQGDPGHRFELLRTVGARLQPEARNRLELIELAGHLAWANRAIRPR